MLKNILLSFSISQCAGIECITINDTLHYNVVLLSLEKGEIHTLGKATNITLEALKAFLPSAIPVYLACSQVGILYKTLGNMPINPTAALTQVFLSANSSDFFTTVFPTTSGSIVGIMRQVVLEEILSTFQEHGISVIHVTVGAFQVDLLLPYLTEKNMLVTATTTLEYEGNQLVKAIPHANIDSPLIPIYQLGDEQVSGQLLVAYSSAFNGLMVQTPMFVSFPILTYHQEQLQYKQWFTLVSLVGLVGLLVALLVNFLLFSHYTQENQTLNLELTAQQNTVHLLDSLRSEVQQKRTFFKNTMLSTPSTTSRYADNIAQILPNDLQLTTFHIFPAQSKDRSITNSLPFFKATTITLKGKSKASIAFNTWKKDLERLDWVKTVSLVAYQEIGGVGEFEILVEVI